MSLESRALGCFLGALVGDAAGATLEFLGRTPNAEDVELAMAMHGGGFFRVAPGQVTDDGELALSLADALADSRSFDIESIARAYARWFASSPFDVGTTTRSSIGSVLDPEWRELAERDGYAAAMQKAARGSCADSKANGSLMRIAPLGLWAHRYPDERIASYATEDSRLSHPNESCCHAVACYTIAIASLLRGDDRRVGFDRAQAWATDHANDEVRRWMKDAREEAPVEFEAQAGFVKIAFTNAFQHLWKGSSYEDTIRLTLAGGGDTDTNACIAGGLVGAAVGAKNIPEAMARAVLDCDTQLGRPRPEFLHSTRVPQLVERLLRE